MKFYIKPNNKIIYYLLAFAFITDYLQYLYDPLHYVSYLIQIIVWVFMLPHIFKINNDSYLFYFILSYFIFLIFKGIINENYYKYIIFDIHIYSSLIFLTFFKPGISDKKTALEIPLFFSKLLMLSIPISCLLFLIFGSFNLTDTLGRSFQSDMKSDLNDKMFLAPIILAPLLVPFIKEMKKAYKFTVLIANSFVLIYGIFTATRSIVAISILAFLSLINIKLNISFRTLLYILLFSSLAFVFSLTNKKVNSMIRNKIDFTISRFEMKGNFTSGRNTEVNGLFKEFSAIEFIFGRGAGAEQRFGFWKSHPAPGTHGINFTHFGFLHLILKGGFILLILVYGLAIYSMIILFRYGEQRYFFVLLIYLIYELSHTQFVNYFYVLFLWLSISYALNLKRNRGLTPGQIELYD